MNERTCICCGKQYIYCPHCSGDRNKPRWMMNYDDEGCRVAFQTVTDYRAGEITKEAAKITLESVELKNRNHFKHQVAIYVDEILDGKVAENHVDFTEANKKEAEAEAKKAEAVAEVKANEDAKVDTQAKQPEHQSAKQQNQDGKKFYQQHDKFAKMEKDKYNK